MNKTSEARIINKTDSSVILEFFVPSTSDFFDGHFPGFPVLPAVAQIDIIMRYVSNFFGVGVGLSQIKRIKFNGLILPNTPLVLNLERNGNTVSFRMNSPDGETAYSAGTFVLG